MNNIVPLEEVMPATILCIDDEALLRDDVVEELVDEGYQVLQAGDGEEGLKQILQHRPDLVISDITMPRMNGYQLLREVRENSQIPAALPFIFLSALTDKEHMIAGLRLGADNFITKPVDFDILRAKVTNCLGFADRIRADIMTDSGDQISLEC